MNIPDQFGEKGTMERQMTRADVDFSLGFPFTRLRFGKIKRNGRRSNLENAICNKLKYK